MHGCSTITSHYAKQGLRFKAAQITLSSSNFCTTTAAISVPAHSTPVVKRHRVTGHSTTMPAHMHVVLIPSAPCTSKQRKKNLINTSLDPYVGTVWQTAPHQDSAAIAWTLACNRHVFQSTPHQPLPKTKHKNKDHS